MRFWASLLFLVGALAGPRVALAASAYTAPTDTPAPAAGATTTTPAATPDATATTPPATTAPVTTPAAGAATAGSTDTPAASTADGAAPVVPAPSVYKPPSVEVAPGGITIYRGSGSP